MSEPTFEEAQKELEAIVERLERGDAGRRRADEALGARRGALQDLRREARGSAGQDRGARSHWRHERRVRLGSAPMAAPMELLKRVPLFQGLDGKQHRDGFPELHRAHLQGRLGDHERRHRRGRILRDRGRRGRRHGRWRRAAQARLRRLLRRDRADRRRTAHGDDRGEDGREGARAHALAVPPARRGERLDRVAAARRDGAAPARDRRPARPLHASPDGDAR